MKYIRTKAGIYDTSNMKWCECSKQASHYKDKNYMLYVPIKEADTIEELCDEFVDVNSLCCSLLNEKEKQDIKRFAKSNLYGAIWTSKGLIYVAKMNDKGVLELL